MTAPVVPAEFAEEYAEFAEEYAAMQAALTAAGYRPVDYATLPPGERVRHRGEQWPEAYDQGTGVVLAVMEKPNSAWSQSWGGADVELIVLKDKPLLPGLSRLAQLANYHVQAVNR